MMTFVLIATDSAGYPWVVKLSPMGLFLLGRVKNFAAESATVLLFAPVLLLDVIHVLLPGVQGFPALNALIFVVGTEMIFVIHQSGRKITRQQERI